MEGIAGVQEGKKIVGAIALEFAVRGDVVPVAATHHLISDEWIWLLFAATQRGPRPRLETTHGMARLLDVPGTVPGYVRSGEQGRVRTS